MSKGAAQKRIAWVTIGSVAIVAALIFIRPTLPSETASDPAVNAQPLERHTLIYGGDLFTSRRLNFSLFDPSKKEREQLFSNTAPLLRSADLAMLNLEGMITTGGYYNRLKACTYMFRAHPKLIDVLLDAGIDLLTIGNNHNGDYGPEALIEQTDHLVQAGIGYTGAGVDRRDAARPVYRRVGDVVIAILGMEMTGSERYRATKNRAGVHFVRRALRKDEWDEENVEYLKRAVVKARKYAHVVIFSPHWDAWERIPSVTPPMRELARQLIEDAGFDGILAHGRHHAQGIELFNGKPVIYDAGNSLIDFYGVGKDAEGMLWQIEFSRAGVHRLEGIPIKMRRNRTKLAEEDSAGKILRRVQTFSRAYGTEVRLEEGRAIVDLDPGDIREPRRSKSPPTRSPRSSVRRAPNDLVHDEPPQGITRLDVAFENGIHLIGYELLSPTLTYRKDSSQTVVLYWRTDQQLQDQYIVHVEARQVIEGKGQRKLVRNAHHIPGDWILPTPLWPVGKIIQDKINLRLPISTEPEGAIAIYVGLRKVQPNRLLTTKGTLIAPLEHDGITLVRDKLIPLRQTEYDKEAPTARDCYTRWRENRQIKLADPQPWGAPPLYWKEK